jgi:KDO2-lipid IV(A) lauroyltransferase
VRAFKHWLEYALVLGFEAALRLLPRDAALVFGAWLGVAVSFVIRKRHRLILENLAHAFPEKTEAERKRIAMGVWRNLGRTAVEFIRLGELDRTELDRSVIWEGTAPLERAMKEKTGAILLTAHFSNWEALGLLFQARFGHFMAIARPMKNPYVDKWVQAKRTFGGMTIIFHREAVKASLKWLKSKNMIGILVDQNLYKGGVFVDFFGRPAATTTLPALLHIRTEAPVFLVYTLREGKTFRAVVEPIQFPEVKNEADRPLVYTTVISNRLEALIRKYPENWFWIHNRWKRKPE